MKARELQEYLQSLNGGWVDPERTVDTFKSGDPDADVRGIAVGWMSYTWALRRALELDCNVFVTHEPTYYDHRDRDPNVFALPGVLDKQRFVAESRLIILRCHDLWDQMPGIGIADSWGAWLGLGQAVAGEGYYRVYDVGGVTALALARQIAQRTAHFGEDTVALVGPADKQIRRASIGTGAITSFFEVIAKYRVDLAICTDDGTWLWRDGGYAIDMGVPLIVVNHAVSEEAGLINLAEHLRRAFPAVPVHHIPQRCMYTLVCRRGLVS